MKFTRLDGSISIARKLTPRRRPRTTAQGNIYYAIVRNILLVVTGRWERKGKVLLNIYKKRKRRRGWVSERISSSCGNTEIPAHPAQFSKLWRGAWNCIDTSCSLLQSVCTIYCLSTLPGDKVVCVCVCWPANNDEQHTRAVELWSARNLTASLILYRC